MEKKYNFTYQTKNLITGKTYIGVHCTNYLNDNYIGCGIYSQSGAEKAVEADKISKYKTSFKSAVVKHGYNNFKREILAFFDTEDEAYLEEAYLVDKNWVKNKDNYNISLGGKGGHKGYGRMNHKYRGDIYIINMTTGLIEGVYESANQIKIDLGYNAAKVSKVVSGKSAGWKNYYFTFNPTTWVEDRQKTLDTQLKNRFNNNSACVKISAYNVDGSLYKTFPSRAEACRHFGKSRHGVNYLEDVADKYRIIDGKPLKAWGYIWKYADK